MLYPVNTGRKLNVHKTFRRNNINKFKKDFFETLKKVLKIVPILTVLLFEISSLIHRMSLFLLGEFLVESKFHVIKVKHEIKHPKKVAVYIYNN